ncbi:malto-oligosyltrehalose trehalohydrolase [Gillisia limnaea]|uniref:Malto-oligosyltrehalose trehalohydrolase n=1 Tax=Gillisia limnaea (strain DSM 15749 / LMG 21470 / R-8282) TaxID=865937 RepID=H2BZU1_GILLR|nr:malto-oligosyltrehalose trehalohydrolase [Gillisia limnaea]EHQ01283.1 maltooligosyl trehalose hydrolase [Gillisia limnaea DSM 15749]
MRRKIGAEYNSKDKTTFTVWAPLKNKVEVIFKDRPSVALTKDRLGYWEKEVSGIPEGSYYKFRLDEKEDFPDPASRYQPLGVHSWSSILNQNLFSWNDNSWKGIPLAQMIIYELHIGTFTSEGTFEAVIGKLDHLLDLGINCIEILPISQFPGDRNWGYDGVYPFAAQESYGGPEGLKKMIDACHQKGVAVILDAVYNHMGPEGNYLSQFGPYFTDKYQTPWGAALNFDDKYSDAVRNFFLENARMWLEEFHFDGLRLDAIHEIIDRGAKHLLKELSQEVDELQEKTGKQYVLIAESDLNDTKIINSYEKGGFGLEGQWVDDFHHSLHTVLTGENEGYYEDYGKMEQLAKAFKQAFVYDGQYSRFRKRTVGNSPAGLEFSKFVVSIQNHDQIGNRLLGERLPKLVSFEGLKLAAGVLLTSPFVPMLFMGEEFAEENPFQYFISHGDPDLVKAVQQGRKREFEYFNSQTKGDFSDPQARETFNDSKLNWGFKEEPGKNALFEYYKYLISLKKDGAFNSFRNEIIKTEVKEKKTIQVLSGADKKLIALFNFSNKNEEVLLPEVTKGWELILASADKKWNGTYDFPSDFKGGEKINLPAHSLIICKTRI